MHHVHLTLTHPGLPSVPVVLLELDVADKIGCPVAILLPALLLGVLLFTAEDGKALQEAAGIGLLISLPER